MAVMRQLSLVLGILMTMGGVLFALQGFGAVQGSPMSNTTTWSVAGPVIAIVGLILAVFNWPRR
jgi:hypothetical protein